MDLQVLIVLFIQKCTINLILVGTILAEMRQLANFTN